MRNVEKTLKGTIHIASVADVVESSFTARGKLTFLFNNEALRT